MSCAILGESQWVPFLKASKVEKDQRINRTNESDLIPNSHMIEAANNIPFEGPEARYFRNVVTAEDDDQPFRHCKTVGDFLCKVHEMKNLRRMAYGLPKEKTDWFLYSPTEDLYKNAEYVPWRTQEEQTFGLLCLGKGEVRDRNPLLDWNLWTRKDTEIGFGVFGIDSVMGNKLQAKWGKTNMHDETLTSSEFYDDIIRTRSDTELSVFVYLNHEPRIIELKKKYGSLLLSAVDTHASKTERDALEKVITWFDKRMLKENFLTEDMRLKRGTKIILSTTDEGGLIAEMISPGPWSSASCCIVGCTDDAKASRTVLRALLGEKPLSMQCKTKVGQHALYLSKGGRLPRSRLEACIPFRDLNDWRRPEAAPYPMPEELLLENTTKLFGLKEKTGNDATSVSLKLLSRVKMENRRRLNYVLKRATKKEEHKKIPLILGLKLCTMPKAKIPKETRRYPVEYPDLQSPYARCNDATAATIRNGYRGYQVNIVGSEDAFNPLEVPTLDPTEEELTAIELPEHVHSEGFSDFASDDAALVHLYSKKRSRKDPYYKGILVPGTLARLDAWGPPRNSDETMLDPSWDQVSYLWRNA